MPNDNLKAEKYDRRYSYYNLSKRIFGYFSKYKNSMILIVCLTVLYSILNIIVPILFSKAITASVDSLNVKNMLLVIILLLGSSILLWLSNAGYKWLTSIVTSNVVKTVREDSFQAVLKKDMSFFDENPSGSIASRILYDSQNFSNAVTLTLSLLSSMFLSIPIISICFYINYKLAIMLLVMVPFIAILPISFSKISRVVTQKQQRALAIINNKIQETINCISVAKNFRQEKTLFNEFEDVNEQAFKAKFHWGLLGTYGHILKFFIGIATAAIIYFGGISALDRKISIGEWYLFVQSIGIFWGPIINIVSFWNDFQVGLVAGERVFSLIDVEPKVIQNDNKFVNFMKGKIEFKDVDFKYKEEQNIFTKFNLTIEAGETIALVGYSGAGKSSIGKLVARFYEFQGGKLYIDGQDIRDFDLARYGRKLGVVPQLPILFTGSVSDNIRFSCPDDSDEKVSMIANQIGNGEWIASLPNGLQTHISEMGKGISMGQRQLISLARVLIQDPRIIIMDEATGSIDPLTESQIQQSIDLVLKNRTSIIIAHRLSTIKNADRIVVLNKGQIVEEGDHKTLLSRGKFYAELYNKYFKHQEID